MNKQDYDDIKKWSNRFWYQVEELLKAAMESANFSAEQAAQFILESEIALEQAQNKDVQGSTWKIQIGKRFKTEKMFNLKQACTILDNHRFKFMQWPAAKNIVIVRKIMEILSDKNNPGRAELLGGLLEYRKHNGRWKLQFKID